MVVSGSRAVERCDVLGRAPFSDGPACLFRPYLGPGHVAAIARVSDWMREAGMTTRIDAAGNLVGRYEGTGDKALIIASHLDSVRDGGKYDGPLGVTLGIECVAALHESGRCLPFAIEVYAFGDEEGSRFPAAMLTSRAVAGQLELSALDVADREGVTLSEALKVLDLVVAGFLDARREPSHLIGYLEAHIEQGPVLEAEGLALGVVTAIAAQLRFEVTMTGIAGHAGTNSMALRKDALTAAAEAILAIERIARLGPDDLVATVGRILVGPGAPNVVPGRVTFSIDIRSGTEHVRDACAAEVRQILAEIATRREIRLDMHLVHDLPASPCDSGFMALLSEAVEAGGHPARQIVSGAGHDAMVFARITPMAMLFIRCKDGISHNPLESVEARDADAALAAMRLFIDKLEAKYV